MPGILQAAARKHAALHMLVLDFLDRAPPGLEDGDVHALLTMLAEKGGAVFGRSNKAHAALNRQLLQLYRRVIAGRHLRNTRSITSALRARFPSSKTRK